MTRAKKKKRRRRRFPLSSFPLFSPLANRLFLRTTQQMTNQKNTPQPRDIYRPTPQLHADAVVLYLLTRYKRPSRESTKSTARPFQKHAHKFPAPVLANTHSLNPHTKIEFTLPTYRSNSYLKPKTTATHSQPATQLTAFKSRPR